MNDGRPGKKVLVIDDDTSNRGVLSTILGRAGYQVQTARKGEQGIALAESDTALAFVDIHLPDMSGIDVVAAVRRLAPDARIVVATMDDDPTTLRAAYAAGCDVFLVKPYDFATVMQLAQDPARGKRWIVDRLGMREYRRGENSQGTTDT